VSTIIDVSELKKHERIIFVKRFLDSLVDSPRKLWHPCLIVVDEAHQFCPQTSKSDSASSVIDLMTRGRKRGFCGVLATQRLSKLHKDAAAECNNKLIGRTGLDVDRKRASEELGFTSKEDERSLRYLDPGQFYAFGNAISKEILAVKVGSVNTSHPEPGASLKQSAPTPENIKKVLKDVIDLPKEVEEEIRTREDMQKKIIELKRSIRVLEKGKPEVQIDEKAIERAREQALVEAERAYIKQTNNIKSELIKLQLFIKQFVDKGARIIDVEIPSVEVKTINLIKKLPIPKEPPKPGVISEPIINGNTPLRAGAMKMLGWLASAHPQPLTKQRIATLAGFSVKGGTFSTYLSELKRNGWIFGDRELSITQEGLDNAPEMPPLPSGEELIDLWASKFRAGAGKLLKLICEKYPNSITKEDLGYESGFEPSGGTFNQYLSELRRNKLIDINGGELKAATEFFE